MYRPSCVTRLFKKYTFSACYNKMVMETSRCKELTENYIQLILASQAGQGIMPNTVG